MAHEDELTCQELVELVTEYLEDTLPPETRARFDAHLRTCRGCSAYLNQMRRTIDVLGTLCEDDLAATPRDELLNAFRTWKQDGPD